MGLGVCLLCRVLCELLGLFLGLLGCYWFGLVRVSFAVFAWVWWSLYVFVSVVEIV